MRSFEIYEAMCEKEDFYEDLYEMAEWFEDSNSECPPNTAPLMVESIPSETPPAPTE